MQQEPQTRKRTPKLQLHWSQTCESLRSLSTKFIASLIPDNSISSIVTLEINLRSLGSLSYHLFQVIYTLAVVIWFKIRITVTDKTNFSFTNMETEIYSSVLGVCESPRSRPDQQRTTIVLSMSFPSTWVPSTHFLHALHRQTMCSQHQRTRQLSRCHLEQLPNQGAMMNFAFTLSWTVQYRNTAGHVKYKHCMLVSIN